MEDNIVEYLDCWREDDINMDKCGLSTYHLFVKEYTSHGFLWRKKSLDTIHYIIVSNKDGKAILRRNHRTQKAEYINDTIACILMYMLAIQMVQSPRLTRPGEYRKGCLSE